MEPSSSSSLYPPSSVDPAKLFVGGITQDLDEDALKTYFQSYGEVKEVAVMRDRVTGKVRGFGFVEFVDPDAAQKAIAEDREHVVKNVSVQVNRVRPRSEKRRNHQSYHTGSTGACISHGYNAASRKIFVGGLSANVTEDEFRRYFEQFGFITDVVIMYDNVSHRPRGFGFITFDSEEAVENALQKSFHELNSKVVEVKRAIPKEENQHSYGGGGRDDSFANYQSGGFYPDFYSRYGYFYGYTPPPISCYGLGYTHGGYYGGISYDGMYSSPRSNWNGAGMMMMTGRHSPVPYTRGYGGNMGVTTGGYLGGFELSSNGKDGTNSQLTQSENTKALEDEAVEVDGG